MKFMGKKRRKPQVRDENIYVNPQVVPVLFAVKGQLEVDLFQGEEFFEMDEAIAEQIQSHYVELMKPSSNEEIQMAPMLVRMMYMEEVFRDLLDKFLVEGVSLGFDPGQLKMPAAEESEQFEWYSDTLRGEVWSYAAFGIPFLILRTGTPQRPLSVEQLLQLPLQAPPSIVSLIRQVAQPLPHVWIGVGGRLYDFRADFAEIYARLLRSVAQQEA